MLVTAKLQFDATRKKHIASPCGLSLPFLFLVRLRDHGAWPGISQYSISHVAFFISHCYLACRIFISHVAFLSRIFISHLVKSLPQWESLSRISAYSSADFSKVAGRLPFAWFSCAKTSFGVCFISSAFIPSLIQVSAFTFFLFSVRAAL